MDRPLAGRGAVAQLDRILDYSLPLRGRRATKRPRPVRRPRSPVSQSPASRFWQLLRARIDHAARAAAPLWRQRRVRVAALALAAVLALLSAGWLWLRHSSLVAVRGVRIVGLHGPQSGAISAALQTAARHMSTLDVQPAALRAAVAPFPVVRDVRAHASFPHGLVIEVTEQPAVAALSAAGVRTAVSADGVVLGQGLLSGSLPTVSAPWAPPPGQRVSEGALREALAVLGAVPAPLQRFVQRVYSGPQGITVVMHSGLSAYFGDATRPHAKWLALALVISNERASGASYVDVRVPERPAAGFAPGAAPPSTASGESGPSGSEHAGSPESVAASIAARLAGAVGVGEPPNSQKRSGSESGSTGEASSSGGSHSSSEAGSSGESHGSSGESHGSGEAGSSGESGAGSERSAGSETTSSSSSEAGH
ncbi:MAG TPA: FtsQ-type POTRA domain-containing protein [Solirubrobacteraceae bacterium]|jgi:cell division protein FtsQ|nr:FtsQ-type POTRA domain-containing protein [Solirubrobacteraceae bacterium]